ncbi:acetyl-CoA C-acetyltransferase, partial [Escherichia coli]
MQDVVIVAATRTPIGSFLCSLAPLSAVDLGATAIRALLEKTAIAPELIDEVILGQVLTAGCGQNPARQTALLAGLSNHTPAVTINQVCGSGLKAVIQAVQAIRCDDAQIIIAGGQESMSNAPYFINGARAGIRLGHTSMKDSLVHDGLWDAFNDYHMGITAENLAQKYAISRERQDTFALHSQQKAASAIETGRFADEIAPVNVPQGKNPPRQVNTDEQPRSGTQLEKLAQLKPAFLPGAGSVTAGNSSSINDGAAAVMLMRASKAAELGLPALARVAGYAVSGVDPALMGIGPVSATRECLKRCGWTLDDIDLIEANEAFAAQALAVGDELNWDSDKVNVNGGAIALGHPIGASGCRILVTLIYEMARRNAQKGLATLCVGGGQGVALALERTTGECNVYR